MATLPEWITEVRFYATTPSSDRAPQARGSVTFAGAVYSQFTVWQSNDGALQVVLPRVKNPKYNPDEAHSKTNKMYFEEVGCTSGEKREELGKAIIGSLLEERKATPVKESNTGSDGIPF
jgi:hypothetical protein